jgi:VanZ family protein
MNALRRSGKIELQINIKEVFIALIFCILYATSDEIHQAFVPGRGPQVKDVFIDSAGSFIGIGMYELIGKFKKVIASG